LKLLNIGQVGVIHMIFDVAPKDVTAGIHVQRTWWSGINSVVHGYQTPCGMSKMTFSLLPK
jgi:hypothetical protein